nr:ABC transporter ATP-binding protein [Clostridia bacterium]
TRFVNNNVYVAVGIVGGLIALMTGGLSIGQLSAFLTYANQYTKPFNEISGVMTQLQMAAASAQRLFAFLDKAEEAPDAPDAICPEGSTGEVGIQSLCFGYTAERPLIQGMTLSVKSGQHVAIVGPTGAGKTTLVNLLMRFYELQGGKILVDGQDIRGMTRDGLRGLFGMVLQDSWLFAGSVRENISYGKPDASLEEVMEASQRAHAHSFIQRLPQGYDTQMEEAGSNLSQGQRQLLCIARVMLVDPPILLLDEATSSIDTRTEQQISKAFDEMTRGRTSFIVAHRLSTIRGADIILVMRDGDIVEQGKHEELLAKQGFYAQLYNSQFLSANAAGS